MKFFFILVFLLLLLSNFNNKNSYAQNKLQENFEGEEFPPAGWSSIN